MNSTCELGCHSARALRPYPDYKDSGVQSLGKVPTHWEVRRLRTVAEMRVSNVDKHTKEGEFPVRLCNYVDVYKNDRITQAMPFMNATASRDEVERFRLERDDVLITKDSEAWDDIGVPALVTESADDLLSGYHLALLRPSREILGAYLVQSLQSKGVAYQFHVRANGVTRYGLTHTGIYSIQIPLPPRPEQATIARFLDHADRRIRRYIRTKQKLIALLEEQKQATVNQAVTGQIDVRTGRPYPAYKPSGVLGLAEVPKDWKLCRLRNVVSVVTTGSRGWSSYASDTGPLFVRVANLSRGSLELRFNDEMRLNLPPTSEAGRTRIEPGDLLVSVTAYIGSVGVAPKRFEEAYVSQHVARCQPLRDMHARWLGYVLLSTVGQIHGQISLYGGTKDGLALDDVKNFPILLPPRHVQDQAVRWIEGKLSALVKIGESTKREIAMVGEYRTRLIADVVTGKLDVREAAAGLPAVEFLAADDTLDGGNAPDDVSDSESEVATSGRDGFGTSPAALSEAV